MSARPFQKVLFATDLSEASMTPWAHALKLSCRGGTELTVLHVRSLAERSKWSRIPTAREMLVNWGVLGRDSTLHEFRSLGFRLFLHSLCSSEPAHGIETGVQAVAPELVVLGTRRAVGLDRLLRGSVSETVARRVAQAVLIVPEGVKPLVHPATGVVGIPRIIVPLASASEQERAVEGATRLAASLGDGHADFVLLHVGPRGGLPSVSLPRNPKWTWRVIYEEGPVVDAILGTTERLDGSVISMMTHGHDSILDVLQGSRAERVIRGASCPVLVQPLAA